MCVCGGEEEYHFGLVNMWTNINGKLASRYHFVQHLIDTSHFRDFFIIISTVEKLNSRRKDLSQYDKFVNTYMASLTEEEKKRNPLANMALATQAWKVKQQKPLSVRVLKAQGRQEAELTTIGLDVECTTMEHVDLGLTSSLANVSTQLPTHHLEKCPTGTNGELDEAGILIETQTQEMSTVCNKVGDTIVKPPQNNGIDILMQMFPQYSREGIYCAFKSCGCKIYDTVDLLLKLLPQETSCQDPPNIISFSQSASSAIQNVPKVKANPMAMALACPSTSSANRKAHFCKKCGHQMPNAFVGSVCPNPFCCYPFQQNLRM